MAKREINMPRFGAAMKQGEIISWEVEVGDHIDKDDVLCEVQAEKMATELESLYSGTIVEIIAEEGESYDVGAVLAYIEED